MGNVIDYAINRVENSDIDPYLLKLAFENPNANYQGNWYGQGNMTTVAQGIRERVIHQLILPACNVIGGKTEEIDLGGSEMRSLGNNCVEVNVPEVTTRGSKIISVTEVYQGSLNSAIGSLGASASENALCGNGVLNDMMESMLGSLASNRTMPTTYTNVHMTGNNCFVIFGMSIGTYSLSAKVIMEYDEGLSSIHPRHSDYFAELVEWAVKAHIYRVCKRPTQEAVYRSGVPLDGIKDDIMEYRDAWTQYKEYFKNTWTPCMAWSDKIAVKDAIRMSVPRRM